MQHENDGKQLKQERKCEYKTLTLHVSINEILSFSSSIIGCNNDTNLRDSERLLMQLTQRGCITAPMENFKSTSTASLEMENSKGNPKDLLLTRVKFDPSFPIKVRYLHSKLVISKIEINSPKIIVILLNTIDSAYNLLSEILNLTSMIVSFICKNFRKLKNDKTFCNNLFFIHYKKTAVYYDYDYEKVFFYIGKISIGESHHRNRSFYTQITDYESKILLKTSLTQLSHGHTLMINDFYNKIVVKITKVIRVTKS